MIGWLNGVVRDKRPPTLLLDVNGVGFELEAPLSTFEKLPETGETCTLHCHQLVREDAHNLYGFATLVERDVFRLLLRVNGVGAKLALAILSGLSVGALTSAVNDGDTATLSRLPGIGKKTAERLIIELRDRLAQMPGLATLAAGGTVSGTSVSVRGDASAEAVNALIALGYKPQEASRLVANQETAELSVEDIVRRALQASLA
jgi:holliday junction DNA helicase RuvA